MKMLGKFWRLRMINATGSIMTYADGARIAIRLMPWKITSGELAYGTVITETLGFTSGTIAVDGEVEGTVVDNSSTLYFGMTGTFKVTHNLDAAKGDCKLYLEYSDADGNWPSDSTNTPFAITDLILLVTLPIDNSAVDVSRSVNFEI